MDNGVQKTRFLKSLVRTVVVFIVVGAVPAVVVVAINFTFLEIPKRYFHSEAFS